MGMDHAMSAAEQFSRLVEIMRRLRRECPWDRSQTFETLRAYLLEETYETLQVLDEKRYEDLAEELGDLLLQIIFQAEIAEERGLFSIADVLAGINAKLVRRHPHVFEQAEAETPEDVFHRWEHIKVGKEQKNSHVAGVPPALPALLKAVRVVHKIRQTGLEPMPVEDARNVVEKELPKLMQAAETGGEHPTRTAGALFLAATVLADAAGVNPEDALREVIGSLLEAFRTQEEGAREEGRTFPDLSPRELRRMSAAIRHLIEEEGQ